jgi:molybdopterin converting factor small subunit
MKRSTVPIRVKFISIMQRHSGQGREVEMDLPLDAARAADLIVKEFQIPWEGNLEKFVRVFVNRQLLQDFVQAGKLLEEGDSISFIPMSGGG